MRIKLNSTILESDNPLVVEQWQKAGYTEAGSEERKPRKSKEPEKEPLTE